MTDRHHDPAGPADDPVDAWLDGVSFDLRNPTWPAADGEIRTLDDLDEALVGGRVKRAFEHAEPDFEVDDVLEQPEQPADPEPEGGAAR